MPDYNRLTLVGRIVADPELRYTTGGKPVCQFRLAVNEKWTDASGQTKTDTLFIHVNLWGAQAEPTTQHCKKGRTILVDGSLKYDTWESPDGHRSKHTVRAHHVVWLQEAGGLRQREDAPAVEDSQAHATVPPSNPEQADCGLPMS